MNRFSVVLDLDHTLVHTTDMEHDHAELKFRCCAGMVHVRKGFTRLLNYLMSANIDVYVFSAGHSSYVGEIVTALFPPAFLRGVSTIDDCIIIDGTLHKILPPNLQSNRTIIIDDRIDVYQACNGVKVIRVCPMDSDADCCLEDVIVLIDHHISTFNQQ